MHHRRHTVLLVTVAALLAPLAVAVGAATSASAHDNATGSTPADGAVLTELPAQFDLTMNEDMLDLGGAGNGFALQIIGPDGLYYGDGCVTVAGPQMSTPAALGAPGAYRMVWQVVSADGHPVSDEYDFSWQPAAETEPSSGSAAAPVCGVPAPDVTMGTGTGAMPSASPAPEASATADPAPSASPTSSTGSDSDPTPLLIGGGALALAAIAAVVLIVIERRRRRPSQD